MNEIETDEGQWRAVQVGTETVGWIGPEKQPIYRGFVQARITVLMGDGHYSLNATDLAVATLQHAAHGEEQQSVNGLLYYSRCFRARVPDASLDLSDVGEVVYSERSIETLNTVLRKLFSATNFEVQSNLHSETPVGVVRKFAELTSYGYPKLFLGEMTWRGKSLNCLLQDTEALVRVIKTEGTTATPNGDRYKDAGLAIRTFADSTPFRSFVEWQTRTHYSSSRKTPENVFLIRASTPQEYAIGRNILQSERLLKSFMKLRSERTSDATFFLVRADDPLEEWVDGEVLSVKKLVASSTLA